MRRVLLRSISLILFLSVCLGPVRAEGRESLSLTFVGDIMAHDENYRMKDFNAIYADVRSYFLNDDLTFGNLEFPVNEDLPFAGYPLFNARLPYVRAALDAGFDVFSLANNHSRDKGELGILKTLGSLILLKEERRGEMYYSGVRGDTAKPFAPAVIYKNGFKIGFLAVTQFLNVKQAVPYVQVVDYLNKEQSERFIEWVRSIAPRYDLLVLSYHGDIEFKLSPSPAKQAFFRALARSGVNIIWAHHPHVLQPYEWIDAGGSRRLIMYSLGNFVSGMGVYVNGERPEREIAFTGDSWLLSVKATRNPEGGVELAAADPVFITSFRDPSGEIVVRRLETLAEAPLPEKWKKFYQARLRIMKKFQNEMQAYLVPEKPKEKKNTP
jgi:hypothetical protein